MWVIGQDFGEVLTGQGTDPGTGPLLLLLAAAYWPLRRRPGAAEAARTASRAEAGLPR
jgi:MYXO-CTERM domain-containing protein